MSLVSQAAFASIANPSAEVFNLQNFNQAAENLKSRFSVVIQPSTLERTSDKAALEAKYKSTNIGQAGRVLLLIEALAGVEIIRREVRNAHLSGKKLTAKEYAKMSEEAAIKVADSGDVWFGIASDLGIGAASKKPAEVLSAIIKDKVARPIFVNLIQSGIMSLIYFVGFQACAQLWRDARLMLDQKDYAKSDRIWSMGAKGMIELAESKNNSDEARISRQMISNMLQILILNNNLRENWFYNTWRLDLATGRFVTLVGGLVTATTVGTTICPGAGTVLGFMFALTGAVLAASLPQSVSDNISQKLKDGRIALTKFQGGQFNWRLRNLVDSYSNYNLFWHIQTSEDEITYVVRELKSIRQRVITAEIEKIYLAETNIQKLKHDLALAQSGKNDPVVIAEINEKLAEQSKIRLKAIEKSVSYYEGQYHEIEKVKITPRTPDSVALELGQARDEIAAVYSFLTTFGRALLHSDQYPASELLLQNYYLRSFSEDGIFQLANQLKPSHH